MFPFLALTMLLIAGLMFFHAPRMPELPVDPTVLHPLVVQIVYDREVVNILMLHLGFVAMFMMITIFRSF